MELHPPRTRILGPNGTAYLDMLRALAASLVLFEHAGDIFGVPIGFPAGLIGVGIFFILSGFLILQSSLARAGRPGPHFTPYMIDRFARVFTAYVPALILVAAANAVVDLGHWGQGGLSTGPAAFVGNLLLLQNYPVFQAMHRMADAGFYIRPYNTAEPFWTIPIEFWIYVVFGLAFFGLMLRERLGLLWPAGLALVAVPVVVWNAAAGGGNGLSLVWLAGAMGGYVWTNAWHRSPHKLQVGSAVLLIGLACLIGRCWKIGWNFQDLGVAMCEVLVILGGLSMLEGLRTLPRMLRSACRFIASYSYSLYLIHNTILIVVRRVLPEVPGAMVIAMIAAHMAAFGLYLMFERHYRQVGAWLKQRAARMAHLGDAVP